MANQCNQGAAGLPNSSEEIAQPLVSQISNFVRSCLNALAPLRQNEATASSPNPAQRLEIAIFYSSRAPFFDGTNPPHLRPFADSPIRPCAAPLHPRNTVINTPPISNSYPQPTMYPFT